MIKYEDFYNQLERPRDYGKYLSGVCPFHDDKENPSLLVFKDGWFKCLSANCNRHGTWVTLWNKLKGQPVQIKSERRTLHSLPTLNGFPDEETLCYQSHIDLDHFGSWGWYMEMRGLTDAINIAEIGYYRGWYTFPVYDRNHKFETVVYRAAPHVQNATNMRYFCRKSPPVMYVPDWRLLEESDYIVVVFGLLDALTLNKFRYPVATSTAGADTFKAEWLADYRKPVYVVPDKGEERTAIELAGNLNWRGNVTRLEFPDGCKDVNDFITTGHEKELLSQMERIDQ